METRMAIVLLCAALAANLPFILNKVAGVWAVPRKHVGWCLLELGVLYFAVGGLAYPFGDHDPQVRALAGQLCEWACGVQPGGTGSSG